MRSGSIDAVSTDFVRDAAAAAAVFGFFASSWFGWAQEDPPRQWRRWLGAGSVASLLVALAGGLLTWQHWSTGTVFGPETGRAFGIVVGIEFLFAGLGCALLSWRGHSQWMSAWVALVVGVHLFPVAAILDYPLIHVVAALVTLAALAAIPLARRQGLAVSAVNGVLVGPVLLGSALLSLGLATM